jgi:hypothetical protein
MNRNRVLLRVCAVLIGLRALTNVFKPFGAGSGLVFFGALLTGWANTVVAPLLGVFMLVYAYGLWNVRRFALPMGIAYGIFVVLNLALFPLVHGLAGNLPPLGYVAFAAVGAGITWGAVWLLARTAAS